MPDDDTRLPEHGCHCPDGECEKGLKREGAARCDEGEEHEPHHDHDHLHLSPVDRHRDRGRLIGTFALTVAMMVFEVIGGWLSGSLALLSDAGHMLTDAAALLLAVLAIWFAGRPADLKRTYGFFRLEVLSALLNGLTLVGISFLIGWEALQRIAHPEPIKAGLMLVVAVIGLAVNLLGMALLSHSQSMNVRAAFLHVVGDALSSVGVIVAGVVTWLTGWTLLDPILSVVIALVIAFGAVGLIRKTVHVLLEAVPEHIDLAEVFGAMKAVGGVLEVHDLHVWTISHSMHALSAHLVCSSQVVDRDQILSAARSMLRERFGIDHATLQIESEQFAQRGR
jgi:cobalt-zinc-cadmium efflux system protein